ncbi:hypothetical protein [Sphingomonas sp. CGMCC 1.13658]|nr:hypothetical protein [Sphingomonas sp. CGMCC 1.13658]MBA2919543.1 hypothetical protein [Sphingomonas sp. CGMCC 1.13658]
MFAAAGLAGCSENPDWKGWVYPNKSDLTRDIPIGAFATLEECRNSARPLLANFNLYIGEEKIEGDYECGYRCKKESGTGGLNVCERTER